MEKIIPIIFIFLNTFLILNQTDIVSFLSVDTFKENFITKDVLLTETSSFLLPEAKICEIVSRLDYPIIFRHRIKPGEHIWRLAKKFGTTVSSLRSTNLLESTFLLPGQAILVHNKRGMFYKVKPGETIKSIARRFNVSEEKIIEENNLIPFAEVVPGRLIFIPNASIYFPEFISPAIGRISSKFGLRRHPIFGGIRFHQGVDITLPYGSYVRSACEGRVIFAGYRGGYGKLVVIKHPNGMLTYYGHLSKIKVKVGQLVNKRQVIGNVGSSGWSTGPHLHFEIRKVGHPVNPLRYLNK
jgi:LysM repeat protein